MAPGGGRHRDEWAAIFRQAPIGVLVLGLLLLLVGAGLILGGVVYLFSGRAEGWPTLLVLFGAGPLAIYLALHFLARRGWAWSAVVAMLGLMLFYAVVRALGAEGGVPLAPLAELVLGAGVLAYLLRPRVRGVFD